MSWSILPQKHSHLVQQIEGNAFPLELTPKRSKKYGIFQLISSSESNSTVSLLHEMIECIGYCIKKNEKTGKDIDPTSLSIL